MYYYTAERAGGRVVKRYVPPQVAGLAATLDALAREKRAAETAEVRAERDRLAALDAALTSLDELADDVAAGAMLAAGYHRHHRGPWRKRRHA
jgi:hypothetical protein